MAVAVEQNWALPEIVSLQQKSPTDRDLNCGA